MSSQIIPVDPFDYIVFGGTGDLAERKLLPALFHRQLAGQLTDPTRIIGASRSEMSDDEYRDYARKALEEHVKEEERDADHVEKFLSRLHYVSIDATSTRGWDTLKALLAEGEDRVRAFYLAVRPSIFGDIATHIRDHGLITEKTRIVVEKPIGRDLKTAEELNNTIGEVFTEDQIFRIDHYLGKETVQNLMALRFANALYEPLWNSAHIDHVQITVAESVGLEGRADYYDRAGALRDMVQNHILQLLCLVAMEAPSSMEAESVRDEKLKVLRSLKPVSAKNADEVTVRGQYKAGASSGGPVKGYLEELEGGVSNTETFVAIKAEINNWRWAGVPFYLRTGKRMDRRVSEIVVVFKEPPHAMFPGAEGGATANRLHICVQPDEGMRLHLTAKEPGPGGIRLRPVSLDLSYATTFDQRSPEAYERLLMDVVRGNPTLFMRRDEVEAAWSWVAPILDRWAESPDAPRRYPAGTPGPFAAAALLERDGRSWQETDQ